MSIAIFIYSEVIRIDEENDEGKGVSRIRDGTVTGAEKKSQNPHP